jgi:large subunit ribosomal protein L29
MKENAEKARSLDAAELNKQLRDAAEQMFRIRFQMSMGQAEGLKKLRSLRKERARMLTILRERELHGTATPAAPKAAKKVATKPEKKAPAVKKAAPKTEAKTPTVKKAPAAKKVAVKKAAPKAEKTGAKTK